MLRDSSKFPSSHSTDRIAHCPTSAYVWNNSWVRVSSLHGPEKPLRYYGNLNVVDGTLIHSADGKIGFWIWIGF